MPLTVVPKPHECPDLDRGGRGLGRRTFLLGAMATALSTGPAQALAVESGVDPVFEWLSALARAAGFAEYRDGLDAWSTSLNPALRRISGHRALRMLTWGRVAHGLSWDAVASMAAHLGGEPEGLVARVPFDPWPASLDARWRGVAGPRFLEAASDAARKAGFAALWEAQRPLRSQVEVALRREIRGFDVAWYEGFFRAPLPARLRVVAAMSVGGNNYGAHVFVDGARETLAVLGVFTSAAGAPSVSGLPILVHEVGHDFVNPVVEAHRDAFTSVGRRLYAANRKVLREQSYSDGHIVVCESLLRACVVRYLSVHGLDVARELDANRRQGFPWTAALAESLGAYEADRARWPTFEDYVPELIVALDVAGGVDSTAL